MNTGYCAMNQGNGDRYDTSFCGPLRETDEEAVKDMRDGNYDCTRWVGADGYLYVERPSKNMNMTPAQKAARTRAEKKQAAFEKAEAEAKVAIKALGYGPRFYAGKYHAIKGLKDGETYYQEQFPGGYSSWQETLAAITE